MVALALLLPAIAVGQDATAREKIESARIALITERLNLTTEQAEKFWPLYREFRMENEALKQEYETAKSRLDPATATDEDKRALLQLGLKLKERKVNIERTYSDRMLRIISAQQLMSLKNAEEDFRRMLLNQLQRRRLQEGRRQQIRERMRQKRNDNN